MKVIMGGQHISADPVNFLEANPYVNQVVIGDGIGVIAEIVEGKINDRIVQGGFSEMPSFPLLDPSIIEDAGYPLEPTYTFPTSGRKSVDFMFGRGCFRRCEFCVAGSNRTHITCSRYARVDQQLEIFHGAGVEELVIQDDAFLVDKANRHDHLRTILSLMKEYGFFWQNNGGVEFEGLDDTVTEMIVAYNSEGVGRCTALYIPFNPRGWNRHASATASMTRRYHRNMENLKRLRGAGIYVFTSSIIGTPDQTLEAFEEELVADRQLVAEGYLDAALPLSATMLPGTRWFESNGHNIVDRSDWAGYGLFATHHRTDHFSPQEIEELMIRWLHELEDVQVLYPWGTAFPT